MGKKSELDVSARREVVLALLRREEAGKSSGSAVRDLGADAVSLAG